MKQEEMIIKSLKLFRAMFDAAYSAITDQNVRVFIQCKGIIAKQNPILAGAVIKSPVPNGTDVVNLNISVGAISNFRMHSDCLTFSARFSTVAHEITIPYIYINTMYSPDLLSAMVDFNLGLMYPKDHKPDPTPETKAKPALSVVK